jgi:hypothetical protein
MGEMFTIKIMRQLTKEWVLPDEMKVSWNTDNAQEVAFAEKKFRQYLADGWIAFSDNANGRKQIFKFDPTLERILLMPPLGGG